MPLDDGKPNFRERSIHAYAEKVARETNEKLARAIESLGLMDWEIDMFFSSYLRALKPVQELIKKNA